MVNVIALVLPLLLVLKSSDISCNGDDAFFKNALENMSNTAEVDVARTNYGNVVWDIIFYENMEVPLFVITKSGNVVCQ